MKAKWLLIAVAFLALAGCNGAVEAPPSAPTPTPTPAQPAPSATPGTTVLSVPDLDCPSCAKKLTAKLCEVPGVASSEPDVDAKTVKVTHKANETPSPKALWEASERGGQVPSKLEGPSGTFTDKPAN